MAQPAATRPASSAPPCFPSWSGGPTRRLAPTLEALAAQPLGLRPETASQPPPPATPSPEADRHQEPEARCPARASTGGHRGGRRSGLPGLRTQAGAHTTYRSRGSLRRQPGSPRPLRNHLPAATGAAGFRFRFPAGRRRSWRVRRSPFLPPPTILSHFGGWGGAPVPAEAAAPFPRNHVGGRRQRPPPPPQRWEARPGRLPRRQGGLPPLPSTPSTPPEGREGWASHRPSS